MKKLLIATLVASMGTPVLAASPAQNTIPPTRVHEETHAGGFYQDVVTKTAPAEPKQEEERKAVAATSECAPLIGGAASDKDAQQTRNVPRGEQDDRDAAAIVPVPDGCAGLGLARPLYGNLSVGAAVGIGAAVVAAGIAAGNHGGGGGGHHSSGTTGTTK